MSRLFSNIKTAVRDSRYLITEHADRKLEHRGFTPWQIVVGLETAKLYEWRPNTKPFPSIAIVQVLPDGSTEMVFWSWSAESRKARLITTDYHQEFYKNRGAHEKRQRWIQRGEFLLCANIEVLYPLDNCYEACLEPKTVRRIETIAKKAAGGDLNYLKKFGPVYQLIRS